MTNNQIILEAIVTIHDIESLITSKEFASLSKDPVVELHKDLFRIKRHITNQLRKEVDHD